MSVSAPAVLRCPVCGRPRGFQLEYERRVRAGKAKLTACPDCRHPHPKPKPTEKDRQWWLQRFSIEEIRELAEAFWPRG